MKKRKCSVSLGEQVRQARQAAFGLPGAADFYARDAEMYARRGDCAAAERSLAITWKLVKKAYRKPRRKKAK